MSARISRKEIHYVLFKLERPGTELEFVEGPNNFV